MAFTSGNAADMGDLMEKLYDYLLTQGWTNLGSSTTLEGAVAVGDARRYWRVINIEMQGSNGVMDAEEVEWRTTASGADQTGSGTAIASSSLDASSLPANAYDNSASTDWQSFDSDDATTEHWLGYDFGTPTVIREISWKDGGNFLGRQLKSFRVQASDNGRDWYTEWEVLNEAAWTLGETRVYTNPTAVSTPYETKFREVDDRYFNVQGPGVDASQRVYIYVKQFHREATGEHYWHLRAHCDYDADFEHDPELQPGAMPEQVYMNGWNGSTDYWFYVNDRRFIIVARMNNVYTGAYCGFILPWATPTQYDFPYYICGDRNTFVDNTDTNARRRMFFDPGSGAGYWRDWDGDWVETECHDDAAAVHNPVSNPQLAIWPAHAMMANTSTENGNFTGSTNGHTTGHFFDAMIPTAQGELPVFPCIMGSWDHKGGYGSIGSLDGVWMPVGQNTTNEQTFVFNGRTFRVFQNLNRVQGNCFCGIEEV